MNNILLNDILHISDSEKRDWTICLNNGTEDGVYSFSQNEERLMTHISWKKHSHSAVSFRNIYTKYCLQFLRLDKDGKYDHWLFLGAFEVGEVIHYDEDDHETYDLHPIERFSAYKERLIVKFAKKQGPKQAKVDFGRIAEFEVVRILDKKYCSASNPFPGYSNVRLSFPDLKNIVINNDDEWRIALRNVNCIYVITDISNGKVYIGSTYGHNGVWGRWCCYVYSNGTGYNDKLEEIRAADPTYPERNFQWSILEVLYTNDCKTQMIIDREKYWKAVFCSREFGNNNN